MARRILLFATFATVVLTVYGSGFYYLLSSLAWAPAFPEPWKSVTTLVLGAFALSPLALSIAERTLPRERSRFLAWPANLFLGFAFYALLLLLLSDACLAFAGLVGEQEAGLTALRWRAAIVVAVALLFCAVGMSSALAPPRITRYEVHLKRWPKALDGFRIAQISDIHIGPLLDDRFARSVTERVNALGCDLIAVTGDLVDGPVRHLRQGVAPFADLEAPHGVYFVTGNHEYFSGADPWIDEVRRLGMRVLRNERIPIGDDEAIFDLAGVDDHRARSFGSDHGEDVPAAVAGRAPERAIVLLAHDPSTFPKAVAADVDLQLSGHTHGGQIWPFNFLVRAAVGFVAGLYRRGASQLIVSRGTGYWGPPMRVRSPAEILEVTLRPEPAQPH